MGKKNSKEEWKNGKKHELSNDLKFVKTIRSSSPLTEWKKNVIEEKLQFANDAT
jgi:hypothetical protein